MLHSYQTQVNNCCPSPQILEHFDIKLVLINLNDVLRNKQTTRENEYIALKSDFIKYTDPRRCMKYYIAEFDQAHYLLISCYID